MIRTALIALTACLSRPPSGGGGGTNLLDWCIGQCSFESDEDYAACFWSCMDGGGA